MNMAKPLLLLSQTPAPLMALTIGSPIPQLTLSAQEGGKLDGSAFTHEGKVPQKSFGSIITLIKEHL